MKKILFLLSAFSIILCISLSAYAIDDNKLYVTAINSDGGEGAGVIYTRAFGTTILTGDINIGHGFKWWKVITAVPGDNAGEYVVSTVDFTSNGAAGVTNGSVSKDVQIPENGFVYACNAGNDYSASGGINYITPESTASFANIVNATVGMILTLNGIDLADGTVEENAYMVISRSIENSTDGTSSDIGSTDSDNTDSTDTQSPVTADGTALAVYAIIGVSAILGGYFAVKKRRPESDD